MRAVVVLMVLVLWMAPAFAQQGREMEFGRTTEETILRIDPNGSRVEELPIGIEFAILNQTQRNGQTWYWVELLTDVTIDCYLGE